MLFNSHVFLFLFLPLVLTGWFGLNRFSKYKAAQLFVIVMSLWFYGYFNIFYVALILASIVGNHLFSVLFSLPGIINVRWRKRAAAVSAVVFNLGILFYYKYYDFFVENINLAFHAGWTMKHIVLPLGISFFTFQQLSFILDRSRGEAPAYSFLDYMLFVVFFPQLIAGPIVYYADIIPQFQDMHNRRFSCENFSRGIIQFVIGLGKKVLLADVLARVVNTGWDDVAALDSAAALAVMLCYTFEIFLDFSGYCDMAAGIGRMMNIRLPVNFDSPYKSLSVKEFWRRWHMTLGAFFTKYVYIPLGGSRKGKLRTCVNTMIVFFLSGLWHGADWTFILWGMLHGMAISLESLWNKAPKRKISKICRWFITFLFVNLTWILFRSDSLDGAVWFCSRLFSMEYTGALFRLAADSEVLFVPEALLKHMEPQWISNLYAAALTGILLLCGLFCHMQSSTQLTEKCRMRKREALALAGVFALSVLSLSGVSTFLYFNF